MTPPLPLVAPVAMRYAIPMPHYNLELEHAPRRVCGVDEAGRGPWAGPVVAAAVLFASPSSIPQGLDDSKKLTKSARDSLVHAIRDSTPYIGIGIATPEEIAALNIWGATSLAMKRAVETLGITPNLALIDGKTHPKNFPCETQTLVGGDGISVSIAAASIIAKTHRDELMTHYAQTYPYYGFERHMGYGTPEHQAALAEHGPCAIHRLSFRPIRELLESAA